MSGNSPDRTRRKRLGVVGDLAVVSVLLAACSSSMGKPDGPIRSGILTSAGGLHFDFTAVDTTVTATARAPFDDGNVRELDWRTDSPYPSNQQSCEDWDTLPSSDPSALLQPGIALRITPTGPHDEDIEAITVTEKIWSSAI